MLDRLAALEHEVRAMRTEPAAIGHNNPPEPIERERPDAAVEIEEAARGITAELREDRPDVQSVARQATRLQRARDEARAVLEKARDKGRERLAEAVVGIVVGGAILLGHEVMEAIGAALHHLQAWFIAMGA